MKPVSQPTALEQQAAAEKAPTIYDVARAAAVSPATVSRVVNGSARVSPAVSARVRAAMARLDFQPYDLSTGRARRATGMVGLVIPDVTNPFWSEVALGAESTLRPRGFGLMLINTGDSLEDEEDVIALLRRKRVDGALVAALRDASRSLHRLRRTGTPVVLLAHGADDGTFDLVTVDGERGTYLTTTHLLERGHRCIAFIGGPPDERTTQNRRAGYLGALHEYDITPRSEWLAEGPGWGYEAGGERVRELLVRGVLDGPARVTALVAANDVLALGAMGALAAAGRDVPRDVSVTGFDDLRLASMCRPALTTVNQFGRERGRVAAELLLERIAEQRAAARGADPAASAPRRIILTPQLVVRDSTRAISDS